MNADKGVSATPPASQVAAGAQPAAAPQAPAGAQQITLRWRVHKGELLFRHRHLRALKPLDLPAPLMGWIVERLEWAVDNMFNEESEGVLVLRIAPENEVTMSLDTVRETPRLSIDDLSVQDGMVVGATHEGAPIAGTVWLERDGVLYVSRDELIAATDTLARDLATTLGLPMEAQPQRLADAKQAPVFLISDEFGFVPIQNGIGANDTSGEKEGSDVSTSVSPTERLRECFAKLW
jgi:hypothetical protein